MCSWVLEGSNDGATWTVLRTHTSDDSIPNMGYGTKSWPIITTTEYEGGPVRHLRIRSTGRNSSGIHLVAIGGFEVYGTLFQQQ